MKYNVITGDTMQESLIDRIFALDEKVYGTIDESFVGSKQNMVDRFRHNPRTFVCLTHGDKLVGYINFFPVKDRLFDQILGPVEFVPGDSEDMNDGHYEEITDTEEILAHYNRYRNEEEASSDPNEVIKYYNTCRDDDISPDEILKEYSRNREENNLFIISIVIDPDFRGRETSTQLADAFINYLDKLEKQGTPINSLSAVCISPDGEKFLRGLNFYRHRLLPAAEETAYHERVYLCWGHYLNRLMEKRMYHKTFHDDIYLFVPFADNPENDKLDELLNNHSDNYHFTKTDDPIYVNETSEVPRKTKRLLGNLNSCLEYEYEGFRNNELDRVYLGRCLFRHTTDRYENETVGEEYADLLLLSYRSAHMYVLVIYLPNCRYSSSMVGDQLSQMKLEARYGGPDTYGFTHYKNIISCLEDKYGLVRCGRGKAFYCMDKLPRQQVGSVTPDTDADAGTTSGFSQEFLNILSGETYFSIHQDFYIRGCAKLSEQCTTNRAIYDYYQAYMSEVSLVMVLNTYEDDGDDHIEAAGADSSRYRNTGDNNDLGFQKLEDVATYVFIVELILLQNTALAKLSQKVGLALEREGNVSYEYINQVYRDYGRTLKLWDSKNFKYVGTSMEAEQIRDALENDELRTRYQEEQEFLERVVDVNSASDERRNGWILGIVGTILALVQLKDYIVSIIAVFFTGLGNLTRHPESIIADESTFDNVFNIIVWGGLALFTIICICNRNRKRYERKRNLHSRERRDDE